MKKILLFSVLLFILSCKKDPFYESINGFKEETLSPESMGEWRWVSSSGGFAGITLFNDTTSKNILTINANKTYKWCKSDTCTTGKWFLGSRQSSNPRYTDTLLFFQQPKVKTNFPFTFDLHKPIRIADTLILLDNCNDCFAHKLIKVKK